MAEDGVIRIGTSVDVSGIKAGMSEAEDAVKSSTSNMEGAYKQVAQATVQFASAQANLRNAIKQSVDGTTKHAVAAKSLVEPLQESAAAARSLAAAKAQLAAVTAAETTAENTETQAIRTNMTARMAASAEIRVFEGNMVGSTRAAGAFLTMLPGMSAAMQAAFPIFGAIALVGVFVQMGEALYKAFDMGGEKARELQLEIAKTSESIEKQNADTQVQIDKLDAETARIEHRPINGVQMALDEASAAALTLQSRLRADNDELMNLMKNQAFGGSWAQKLVGNMPGADDLNAIVQQHQIHLSAQSTPEGKQQETQRTAAVLQERLNNLLAHWGTEQERANALRELGGRQTQQIAELSASSASKDIENTRTVLAGMNGQITASKEFIQLQKSEEEHSKALAQQEKDRIAKSGQSAANKAAEAERKAQEEKIKTDREALDAAKSTHAMTALDESQFWVGIATMAKFGSLEYRAAVDEANKATGRAWKENETISNTVGSELTATYAEVTKAADDLAKKQAELPLAIAESAAKSKEAHDKANESFAMANVKASEANGTMTKLGAAHATAAIHAKEYADELARIDEELTKISEDESMSPAQRTQKVGQLQAQKVQVQGQASTAGVQDEAAIQQQISAPYLKAFDQINSGWMKVQNQMMYSTRNLSMEFAKMGQSILISVVDNMEMAALKTVEKELIMRLAHKATVVSNVATDATGAASSEAISKGLAATQGLTAAKIAYQNTYAQVSKWPDVGPILAPVLASAAFVAVAAFEDGSGYIPRTGMAMLHEGEAVIPAPTMRELRGDGGGGGGGDINIQQHNNWAAGSKEEFRRQLRENAAHVAGAVKQHLRQGGR